jgi:hypothetical protein
MSNAHHTAAVPDDAAPGCGAQLRNALSPRAGGGANCSALAALDGDPVVRPATGFGAVRADAALLGRRALRRRTARLQRFSHDLAQDGVWNILLELVIAKAENRSVPIKCLWLASGAPQSTALRWVNHLVESGHVTRNVDPLDARRQFIGVDDELALEIVEFLRLTES